MKPAAAILGILLAARASAAPPVGEGPVRPLLGSLLDRALKGAAEKLATPRCLLLLSDFSDGEGRPLAERLEKTGLDAPRFLARLVFRDGRNEDPCHRRHVDAFTSVGASTVWVCPGGSLWLGGENNRQGPNTLIHEMLHALGLRENPPTSAEINRSVRDRCGL